MRSRGAGWWRAVRLKPQTGREVDHGRVVCPQSRRSNRRISGTAPPSVATWRFCGDLVPSHDLKSPQFDQVATERRHGTTAAAPPLFSPSPRTLNGPRTATSSGWSRSRPTQASLSMLPAGRRPTTCSRCLQNATSCRQHAHSAAFIDSLQGGTHNSPQLTPTPAPGGQLW